MSANLGDNGKMPTKSVIDFGRASCKYIVRTCQLNMDLVKALLRDCKTQKCRKEAGEVIKILVDSCKEDVDQMFGYCKDSKHGSKVGPSWRYRQSKPTAGN